MKGLARPRHLVPLLILLGVLRWWLGTTPGYPPDTGAYKRWALWGGTRGVQTIYEDGSFYDYPPLYGYILAPIGQVVAAVDPDHATAYLSDDVARRPRYSPLFSLVVKLPPLVFDLLMALLLARLASEWGLWPARRTRGGWAPALLYLCHPAVLFLSGYWGQPDAIETYFVMLGLTLILLGKAEAGWVAAALGLLMKPIAAPFFPLLALATLLRSGWRRLATGGLAAAGTFVAGLLPFLLSGRGAQVASKLLSDVDIMPFTSVNAHNLWWLLGPWRNANDPWLGPLTPKMVGLALFGLAYAAILLWAWRQDRRTREQRVLVYGDAGGLAALPVQLSAQAHWFLAAAAVAFSFFTLSTHMHENHLFPALPFLMLLAGRDRRWAWVLTAAGLVLLVNMFTHDINTGTAWLSRMGQPSGFYHPDLRRPMSQVELGVATSNAVLAVVTFVVLGYWMARELRSRRT